jgi:hypothetical protein
MNLFSQFYSFAVELLNTMFRALPKNPKSLIIPDHSSDCLDGFVFSATGVGNSMTRDEAYALVQSCGAKVVKNFNVKTKVPRVTTLLVGEEDPSPRKVDFAQKSGIEIIDERGLVEIISNNTLHPRGNALFKEASIPIQLQEAIKAKMSGEKKPRKPREKKERKIEPKPETKTSGVNLIALGKPMKG